MHHVAVGDDIFLAFEPQLAGSRAPERARFIAEHVTLVKDYVLIYFNKIANMAYFVTTMLL